ncbi:hypothetical protein GCM10028807_61610 [Spirosoma daeguense]
MNIIAKAIVLSSMLLIECKPSSVNGGYEDIGHFPSRTAAQNEAIRAILVEYNRLPAQTDYKISY